MSARSPICIQDKLIMISLRRIFYCLSLSLLLHLQCYADVKSDATSKIRLYYSWLQQYAADPSRVELNNRIQELFVDGKGSVYNDIYSVIYKNPETNSDVLNYLTAVAAYKNKSGGHPLSIEVNSSSFQYRVKDYNTVYVTVSKRVYCLYGSMPVDFVTKEVVMFQNNKIVCIYKAGASDSYVSEENATSSLVINNIEFGSSYKGGATKDEFGSVLYAREIPYLNLRISYKSYSAATVYVKILDPDGKLSTGTSSPEGYTTTYTLSPQSSGTFVSGWGNEEMTVYRPGYYTVELWHEGRKIYSKQVYLYSKGPSGSMSDVKVALEGDNVVVKSTFSVKDMKDQNGCVSCYFYDSNGKALTDTNSSYNTSDGKVAVSRDITPGYDNSKYTDFEVNLPKSELHQSGSAARDLKVMVVVWDKSSGEHKELFRSGLVTFSYTPPHAQIDKVWLEHNVERTGYYENSNTQYTYKVMRIHVDFVARGMLDKKVRICAYFYGPEGSVMQAKSTAQAQYRTSNGQLTVQDISTATYENSRWSDFVLEIPNTEFSKGSNKVMVQIHDQEGNLLSVESKYAGFDVN